MKILILSLLLLTSVLVVNGQAETEGGNKKLFTQKEIREDYLILRKVFETTYPSLYRFTDSLIMTKYLNDQLKLLDRPMTEPEFYKAIVLTCAKINDEHILPTPSKNYYESLRSSNHYFPFSLKIVDRRLFAFKNFNLSKKLPVGSEILSINGHSAEDILNILLPTISSDGYIQTFNNRHLEDFSMTQNENLFDLNYPIFIEDTNSFRIEFIRPEAKSKKELVTVTGLSFNDYEKFYKNRRTLKAPLEFKYLRNDIAYLRISSFHKWYRDDFNQNFYALYDSIFNRLSQKQTKSLILDLRNNEGGDGTGEKLLTYLLMKPYQHFDITEEKYTGYPPMMDYLENGKDLFFPDSIVYQTNAGMFRLKKEYYKYLPLLNEQQPTRNHYTGKLYVLINGASGSMASVVASFLRTNQRAIFIGEESGGTMEGNTSLAYAQLVLPNTRIRIEFPLTKTEHHTNFTKGRGVFPDYHVAPEIEDIITGIDTELNFTIHLIEAKKR